MGVDKTYEVLKLKYSGLRWFNLAEKDKHSVLDCNMSYGTRPGALSSHIRPSSGLASNPSASTQTNALQARINEKKVELENLRQLRDLSAALAGQMQQLEQKLQTLSDGTEAVAAVLGNWNSVLRAIQMASGKDTANRMGLCGVVVLINYS